MINKVLIYNSGGGLGDSIQILPLLNALKEKFSNADFYYLSAHENHFNLKLKDLNFKIKSLNLNLKYFGFRWWHAFFIKKRIKENNFDSFDLIIDLQSKIRNTLLLKIIPHKYFISSSLNFKFSNPKISIKKEEKINNTIIKALNDAFNINLKLLDFNINDIDKKFFAESLRLLPKNNYIGFSITQGNLYRKKMWPLKNIVKLCKEFSKINKIPVFFIEKRNLDIKKNISELVPNAIFPEHETELNSPALVSCLGKRLEFVISIDNGVMHMLSLSKVPMIILFGPTKSEKFAPNYNGIVIIDSKKIYNTSKISSISPEDVLQATKQYLNF
jgi:ADP-heptose:LPS heptosyltransferase